MKDIKNVDVDMVIEVKPEDLLQVKHGALHIKNVKRIEVAGKDILQDLLRIIDENPPA